MKYIMAIKNTVIDASVSVDESSTYAELTMVTGLWTRSSTWVDVGTPLVSPAQQKPQTTIKQQALISNYNKRLIPRNE